MSFSSTPPVAGHDATGRLHVGYSASPPPPPPKQASRTQTPTRGPPLPPPPPYAGHQGGQQVSQTQTSSHPPTQALLPEAGWLPSGLAEKSVQDLHELLQNPELQAALLDNASTSYPIILQAQQPLKDLLDANTATSESLIALEAQVLAQREATQSRLLSLRALEQQHRAKVAETEKDLSPFSPPALYQKLSASVLEQDALLKGIEDSFLEESGMASDREVQDFIRRVREGKRLAFLRHERKMRWDEARVGGWR